MELYNKTTKYQAKSLILVTSGNCICRSHTSYLVTVKFKQAGLGQPQLYFRAVLVVQPGELAEQVDYVVEVIRRWTEMQISSE